MSQYTKNHNNKTTFIKQYTNIYTMRNKKAEGGIGTLILFIAMLLVAAIAAGVLIQTTGALQNKALSTGQQARTQISTHVQVISVSGTNASDNMLDNLSAIIKLAPGSESIEFDETVIMVSTKNTMQALQYESNQSDFENIEYIVSYMNNGTDHRNGYLVKGDVARIDFMLPEVLLVDQEAKFDIIPKVGIPVTTKIMTTNMDAYYNVMLYP